MDIDILRTADRETLMRAGACFYCKEKGHLARDCPKKTRASWTTPTPLTGSTTASTTTSKSTRIATLKAALKELNEEEWEELAAEMEDFPSGN